MNPSSLIYVGPFEHHEVVLNGHRVPYMDATPTPGGVHICLDNRLGLDLSDEEAERVIPFLADCIAVAMGYTCFPCPEVPLPARAVPWPTVTDLADGPPTAASY